MKPNALVPAGPEGGESVGVGVRVTGRRGVIGSEDGGRAVGFPRPGGAGSMKA